MPEVSQTPDMEEMMMLDSGRDEREDMVVDFVKEFVEGQLNEAVKMLR